MQHREAGRCKRHLREGGAGAGDLIRFSLPDVDEVLSKSATVTATVLPQLVCGFRVERGVGGTDYQISIYSDVNAAGRSINYTDP